MIAYILNTFYPNVSFTIPTGEKLLDRDDIIKLRYLETKDGDDSFQIELSKEGDKYILSCYASDDKYSLPQTEFTNEGQALHRFETLIDNIKEHFNIVKESSKSTFKNEIMFEQGGLMKKRMKVEKVMREFKKGMLKTSEGRKVTDEKQAIAIALSEASLSKKEMGGFIESFRIPNYNLPLDYFALKNGDMNTTTSDFELQNPT
jgi:hypothetical protein